jgi:hypothetical protein
MRHLTNNNPCSMVQQKLKNMPENVTLNVDSAVDNSNTTVDPTINAIPNSISSIKTPLEKRKRNQTSCSPLSRKQKKI